MPQTLEEIIDQIPPVLDAANSAITAIQDWIGEVENIQTALTTAIETDLNTAIDARLAELGVETTIEGTPPAEGTPPPTETPTPGGTYNPPGMPQYVGLYSDITPTGVSTNSEPNPMQTQVETLQTELSTIRDTRLPAIETGLPLLATSEQLESLRTSIQLLSGRVSTLESSGGGNADDPEFQTDNRRYA